MKQDQRCDDHKHEIPSQGRGVFLTFFVFWDFTVGVVRNCEGEETA